MFDESVRIVVCLGWLGEDQGSSLRKIGTRSRLISGSGSGSGSGPVLAQVAVCWIPGPEE